MSTFKWTDEVTAQLLSVVNGQSPVSAETIATASETLGTSVRSVAAKLRKLGHTVVSMAKTRTSVFSPEDADALRAFVESASGSKTCAEIAETFQGGKFTTKQVQGKLLSLELTGAIKKAVVVVAPRTYTPEQEEQFVKLAASGAYVEEIASAFGKSIESIRGKALSMLRMGTLAALPKQKESHAVNKTDAFEELMDRISDMTIEEIASATEKTERGVKTALTRRGITCRNYDGAAKKAKAASAGVV